MKNHTLRVLAKYLAINHTLPEEGSITFPFNVEEFCRELDNISLIEFVTAIDDDNQTLDSINIAIDRLGLEYQKALDIRDKLKELQ